MSGICSANLELLAAMLCGVWGMKSDVLSTCTTKISKGFLISIGDLNFRLKCCPIILSGQKIFYCWRITRDIFLTGFRNRMWTCCNEYSSEILTPTDVFNFLKIRLVCYSLQRLFHPSPHPIPHKKRVLKEKKLQEEPYNKWIHVTTVPVDGYIFHEYVNVCIRSYRKKCYSVSYVWHLTPHLSSSYPVLAKIGLPRVNRWLIHTKYCLNIPK